MVSRHQLLARIGSESKKEITSSDDLSTECCMIALMKNSTEIE